METNRFLLANQKTGPIPIAEILPAVLARYTLAGSVREDATANPAERGIATVTVVEVGA